MERSLDGLLGTATKGVPTSTDVEVLQATSTLVLDSSKAAGPLHGTVDPSEVGVIGHSAGAGAAYALASVDLQVKAWISYSVGFGGQDGPVPAKPNKPGMVMLGTSDGIIPPTASDQVYAAIRAPEGPGAHRTVPATSSSRTSA